MGARNKKKLKRLDFDRVGRIAKYFKQKPSSYFPQLDTGEALLVDEMCIIVMERNNKIYQEKYKKKEEEKKKKEQFNQDMSKMFERNEGEVW